MIRSWLALAGVASAGICAGQQNFWTNPNGGPWESPGNWSLGLPQPSHECFINFQNITVTHSTVDSIQSLMCRSNLTLRGGKLTLLFTDGQSEVHGQLRIEGGSLGGPATMFVMGGYVWDNGAMADPGHTVLIGNGEYINGVHKLTTGRTLLQRGSALWRGGPFELDQDAEFELEPGATLTSLSTNLFRGGSFTSKGTLVQDAPESTTDFDTNFVQQGGKIIAQQGVIRFLGNGSFGGELSTVQGWIEIMAGSHSFTSGASFAGDLRVTGGLLELLAGSSVRGSTFVEKGICEYNQGASFGSGDLELGAEGVLDIRSGTLTQTGQFANFDANSKTLTDGRYILRPDTIFKFTGADIRKNNAHISLSGSADRNSGQIQDESGNDGLSNLTENNGTMDVEDEGEVNTQGSLGNNGTMNVSGGGDVNVSGSMGNNGTMDVREGGTANVGGSKRALGIYNQSMGITIVDGILRALLGVVVETGVLTGQGRIESRLRNNGVIKPGSPVGNLTITQSMQLTRRSSVHVELGGKNPGQFDTITVGKDALIRGKVEVFAVNGFQPQVGDTFEIIVTTGFTMGNFSEVVSHVPNRNFVASRSLHGITLKVVP